MSFWMIFETRLWYVAALLTAATSFFNILLVSFTARNILPSIKIKFILYSAALTLWSLNVFLFTFVRDREASYFYLQLLHLGAIFIPVFLMDFVITFLNIRTEKNRTELLICTIFSIAFLIVSFYLPRYFAADVAPKRNFPFFMVPGPLYIWWVALFSYIVISAHIKIYIEYTKKAGVERQRLAYFFVPSLLAYTGCVAYFLPIYDKFFFPYPWGSFGSVALSSIIAYGILRHKLFGVDVILKKTLVFAGLLAFVFAIFSAAALFVKEILGKYVGESNLWTYAISLFLIVLGYDPIRNLLVDLTDNFLFQKKYNYQQLLKDASRGMSKIESLNHLLGLVVHFVTMKMRIRNAAVLTREKRSGELELIYQRGYERNFLAYHLDDTNPLINYLQREKEPAEIEKIREYIEDGNKKKVKGEAPHQYDFAAILATMEEIQAACCVPSFLGRELRNILVLGEKKSGDYYNNEDLNVLMTLAQESAIAIENARLFDEAVAKSQQLEKINEQLEFSKTLLMKALHETEIANKQLQDTQAQLIHEQKMATLGRLAASVGHEVNNPLTILSMNVSRAILKYRKNPDLRVGEVLDLFQKMEQNIGRIKAVVNTLTGLLRRSEKGKFEPLSLKLILEETLPLVQFQTYLDNLTGTEVEFDIPGNIPLIRGDLERLQEVFLNLFINAYHAMAGKRNRKIRVTADLDAENAALVAIHFTDNGSGMSEEVMKKIFNYGFTTKPPGKGSGLGLYMCKYIVELHGGDMKVSSKLGEGTTFTIQLPIYEEAGSNLTGGTDDMRQAGG